MFARLILGAALAGLANTANAAGVVDPVVHIDLSQTYQIYDGMGISEAFQRSRVLHGADGLTTKEQTLALDLLFSNTTGAGFTILRNGLGSSPSDPWDHMESICPVEPASNSSALNFIPLPRHDEYQVWLSKQAIQRGVKLIYADAWSADGYMKTEGTDYNGGYLCGVANATCASGDWRQAYANKIVKYIQDYASHGITVDYVGFLNEPDLNTTYASMQSDGQQAADFLEVLYPTIQAAGLTTQIACCDGSGWEQNRERLTGIQEAGAEDTLGIVTAHGYSSAPSTPFNTTKRVWETEWSTFDGVNLDWYDSGSQSEGLTWANHIQSGFAVSNVSAFFYWWGAANATDNEPLVFTTGDSVVASKRLWAFAHYARFIHPGAYRVEATVTGSDASSLNVTAFANSDGSVAVQVINNGDSAETVSLKGAMAAKTASVVTWLTDNYNNLTENAPVSTDKQMIVAEMPARSLMSFVISATK